MQRIIAPALIKGNLQAPASKSVMQRACAAALLRNGTTIIRNYGRSDDDKAALSVIQQLGAEVSYTGDTTLEIHATGVVKPPADGRIHCGESGLSLRMFAPVAALAAGKIEIGGQGSLLQRPLHFIAETLGYLGVSAVTTDGNLPLRIEGPLQPASVTIDGGLTSQLLTGLLMAYSVAATEAVTITVTDLKSRSYIDLTLAVMQAFGMRMPVHEDCRHFRFAPGPAPESRSPLAFTVEADWSNAAFHLVAGALAGSVTLSGLDVFSTQADKKILEALQECGCRLSIQTDEITVTRQPLKAFHFDATGCPDLFPPLVALAACCAGTSVLEGVHRLRHKESDRAMTLQQEFGKMGVPVELQDDKMIVKGGGALLPAHLESHHDHRIAMACAVAALRAEGPVTIGGAEAVAKSYPDFWKDLETLYIR